MWLPLVSLYSMKPVFWHSLWKDLEKRKQNIGSDSHLKNNKTNSWALVWPQPSPRGGPREEGFRLYCPWGWRSPSLKASCKTFQWCSPWISQATKVLGAWPPCSLYILCSKMLLSWSLLRTCTIHPSKHHTLAQPYLLLCDPCSALLLYSDVSLHPLDLLIWLWLGPTTCQADVHIFVNSVWCWQSEHGCRWNQRRRFDSWTVAASLTWW
jgi:hypothetical protein